MFKPGLMKGERILITGGGTGLGKENGLFGSIGAGHREISDGRPETLLSTPIRWAWPNRSVGLGLLRRPERS